MATTKLEKFAAAYPESPLFENPSYATVYVRQNEGSYIDRVAVLPEMPADHPVMLNMERWGFAPVARIYADQIASFVYKGFYNVRKAEEKNEGEEVTPLGTYCSTVIGERIENEDGEALLFNVFMFKGLTEGVKIDAKGKVIKDQNGHAVLAKKGYIREVSFVPFEDKATADKILSYKTAALPLSIKVKGIKKIDILATQKARMFTVSGKYLSEMVLNIGKYQKATNPETATTSVATPTPEPVYADAGNGFAEPIPANPALERQKEFVAEATSVAETSGVDDLPF